MSWGPALCIVGLTFVLLALAGCALRKWHDKRYLRVPYSELNRERITPSFKVGSTHK
jgi:hypothetical protein